MKKLIIALLLLVPLSIAAEDISLEAALALAEKDENALQSNSMTALLEAQAKVATSAFPDCIQKLQAMPVDFDVVTELSLNGTVKKIWVSNSKFASCFAQHMQSSFKFMHDKERFYTAFSYTHKRLKK